MKQNYIYIAKDFEPAISWCRKLLRTLERSFMLNRMKKLKKKLISYKIIIEK